MTTLRAYQQRTIDQLYAWWMAHPGNEQNPLVVVPTGGGKSIIIAELCRLLFDTWPEDHPRTVVVVPSKELAEQNAAKLVAMLPSHIRVGYYSASLGRKQPDADVIVATIGSIYKSAHVLGNIRCVCIDECFTGDTLVSTPAGQKRIDSVFVGDEVYTATGTGKVQAVSRRNKTAITTIRFSDGTCIRTTDNHPFFTATGWKPAEELARGERVVRLQDMPALWRGLSSLDHPATQWDAKSAREAVVRDGQVLLHLLLKESGERHVGGWGQGEDDTNAANDWAQTTAAGWQRSGVDAAPGSNPFDAFEWLGSRVSNQDWGAEKAENTPDLLQGGHWASGQEDRHRTGRQLTHRQAQGVGHEEGRHAGFTWVESVSREELPSAEPVFNLQVGGHPSYFAGGVLVHNCHLVNPDGAEAGRFRQFLSDLGKYCAFRTVGFTATPFRGNGTWLTEGDAPLFTGVAHTVTVAELLEARYLAPLVRPMDVLQTRIDTSGIKTTSGDYNLGELSERVDDYLPAAADEACALAADRRKWLAFTATVVNAQHLAQLLCARGVRSAVVTGDTPKTEREELIAQFRRGDLRCLVTVLALATGFDVPDVDCLLWLRPTKSPVLYVQGAGRGFRIADGKDDCLWLDFSDTTERLGPVDAIKGRKRPAKSDREAVAPHKTCDNCGEQCPAAAPFCPSCGFEFPAKVQEVREASNAAILAAQARPRLITYPVDRVEYRLHTKEGKPDSIRVDYWSGYHVAGSEWVCLDHGGFAAAKAQQWWAKRNPDGFTHLPGSTHQALEWIADGFTLSQPTGIVMNETGKFPELVTHLWEQQTNEPDRVEGDAPSLEAAA